jgi:hypothetical protein
MDLRAKECVKAPRRSGGRPFLAHLRHRSLQARPPKELPTRDDCLNDQSRWQLGRAPPPETDEAHESVKLLLGGNLLTDLVEVNLVESAHVPFTAYR